MSDSAANMARGGQQHDEIGAVAKWGYIAVPKHDCLNNSSVIHCNNVTDHCKCRICGKEWTEPCSFDDDYA